MDAAACQTRAYSYVRELGERGDIETLIDLYHDANRRVEEATKRDAKIQSFVGGERSGVAVAKKARETVKGELFDRFMEVARATESDRFDADTRRDAAVAAAVFYREICETVNRLEASLRMTEEKALDAEARLAEARLAEARLAEARLASAERFRSATPPPPAHVAHSPTHAAGLPVAYPMGMQPPAPRDPAQMEMTAARRRRRDSTFARPSRSSAATRPRQREGAAHRGGDGGDGGSGGSGGGRSRRRRSRRRSSDAGSDESDGCAGGVGCKRRV